MIKKKLISSFTIPVNRAIHLITFNHDTEPVGSFAYKLLYPGDIDMREEIVECCSENDAVKKISIKIRNMIKNIIEQPGYYLADFKAGLYKGIPLRWNSAEIILGYKIVEGNVILFENALKDDTIVKIDIWAPINGRYVELSNFMILIVQDQNGNQYLLNGEQPDYIMSVKKDVVHYFSTEGNNAFKAIKRMMLLAKAYNDNVMLGKILPLINSGAGSLYQVVSDMNTISEMVVKLGNASPYEFLFKEIDEFKSRLSFIFEFNFDEQLVYNSIDNIVRSKMIGERLVMTLDKINEYLLNILNQVSFKYAINNNIYPPPPNYIN